jgi:Fe-S-cluster-containing hydrogenase component 2
MYVINQKLCTFCAGCSSVCPVSAIEISDTGSAITKKCNDCGNCFRFCPIGAIDHEI